MTRLGVLVSGGGTNLQAILDSEMLREIGCRTAVVLSNKKKAYGLERARKAGAPTEVLGHKGFAGREEYDAALVEILRRYEVDLVCLAGFMRIVTPVFLRAFPGRVLNIHPALLPSFPGVHAQRQAFEYGVKVAGCTVHFVDEGVDTGPVIVQRSVPVLDDDTEETLAARILEQEHQAYPEAIRLVAQGKVRIEGRRVVRI